MIIYYMLSYTRADT